ncbi:motile sperm domain-containing protein 2-like isoform X2 [Tachypleus tridentatus]|uniref:motile sperm domain-containing protein 2-like isoform X2 n=1 Tax=Tachypleus tridentatus TaxID=6853 RepID=UPI003FD2A6D6
MSPLGETSNVTSISNDTSINLELVTEVRKRILEELNEPDWKDNYDQRDVERLKQDNWYCARFIKHQKEDIEDSLNMIRDTLKWRKEMGINDLGKENLPAEYFTIGATFPYSCDKAGCRILVMRVKLHKKNSSTLLEQKKFVAYWVEKLDRETNGGKISLLMDCADSGLSNMDMDLIMYIITLFKYYFPFALGYIYVYEMPWLFNACWKIVKSMLPAEATRRFKFINNSSIKDYIALDQLPVHLGGSCTLDYAIIQSNGKQSELSNDIKVNPPKKKVHFSKEDEIHESEGNLSFEQLIEKDAPSDSSNRASSSFVSYEPEDQGIPPPPPPFPGDTITLGSLLKVCPGSTLVFPETNDSEPARACLTLTNITSNCVAYKLKTNNLEIYRVRPPVGIIEPGGFKNVHIQLTEGSHCGLTDKFLLLALEVEEKEPKVAQVNSIWKKSSPQNSLEHKFKCVNFGSVLEDKVDGPLETDMHPAQTDSFPWKRLEDKMEAMHKEIVLLRHQSDVFQKCKNIGIILLLCIVFLQVVLIKSCQFSAKSTDNCTTSFCESFNKELLNSYN